MNIIKKLGFGLVFLLVIACQDDVTQETSEESRKVKVSFGGVSTALVKQKVSKNLSSLSQGVIGPDDELYFGEMLARNLDTFEEEVFEWSAYINNENYSVQSNRVINLAPGPYRFITSLSRGNRQYAGVTDSTVDVVDGSYSVSLTIRPVIGDTFTTTEIITQLADFKCNLNPGDLNIAGFSEPKLGVIVDSAPEIVIDINPTYGNCESYVNLPDATHDIRLNLYDGQLHRGKSVPGLPPVEVKAGDQLSFNLIPLHGEIRFSMTETGDNARFIVSVPVDIIDEAGGLDELDTVFRFSSPINGTHELSVVLSEASSDYYTGETILNNIQCDEGTLSYTFRDNGGGQDPVEEIGWCNGSITLDSSGDSARICEVTLRRRAIMPLTMLAVLGVSVKNAQGAPVGGATIIENGKILGITSNGQLDTPGYLKIYLQKGDHAVQAEKGTYFGQTDTHLDPFEIDNIIIDLDMTKAFTVIVDDYSGAPGPEGDWYYSRIGTDRGEMGDGTYTVNLAGGGIAEASADFSSWAGVWTSLMHTAATSDELNPSQILGPYIKTEFQPSITALEVVASGSGRIKVEVANDDNVVSFTGFCDLSTDIQTCHLPATFSSGIKKYNWILEGPGQAKVEEIRFVTEFSEALSLKEMAFLSSYGHFSQCYDPATGLTHDRARWPIQDYSSTQTIGMFALSSVVAWNLGFIDESDARTIAQQATSAITALPRFHGLFPHFLKNGIRHPDSEWSSIDTVITLTSGIQANQLLGEPTGALESLIQQIDWGELTVGGTRSVSHGYDKNNHLITTTYDTFGSEAILLGTAYSSVDGSSDFLLEKHTTPPTFFGSGFNAYLATLFFPMEGSDSWGNDWHLFLESSFNEQWAYFDDHYYRNYHLFGLSASETCEPWADVSSDRYGAWGTGGHFGIPNDGSSISGYPIVAPHYAAMISKEQPEAFNNMFWFLIHRNLYSPLNNVESLCVEENGKVLWNSLKNSWNLSLQTLGLGRGLSENYVPYQALSQNSFLNQGYRVIMP